MEHKVKFLKSPEENIVPMYQMKTGQYGIIQPNTRNQSVVGALVSKVGTTVFTVNKPEELWPNCASGKHDVGKCDLPVRILPKGTKLEITIGD